MWARRAGWLLGVLACAACGPSVVVGDTAAGSSGDTTSAGTGSGPATFACGTETCHAGQTCYSTYLEGGPGPAPPPSCTNLPTACGAQPSCDCMNQSFCGGQLAPGGKCACDGTGCFVDCVMP